VVVLLARQKRRGCEPRTLLHGEVVNVSVRFGGFFQSWGRQPSADSRNGGLGGGLGERVTSQVLGCIAISRCTTPILVAGIREGMGGGHSEDQ
jgi:hypothetical protein